MNWCKMLAIIYHSKVFLSSSIFHAWLEFRRDEMFYTEHDFQVGLENINLKIHAERIQDSVDNGQYFRSNSYRSFFLCIIECIL